MAADKPGEYEINGMYPRINLGEARWGIIQMAGGGRRLNVRVHQEDTGNF